MTGELPPYPEYKETGLPWLGRVPRHWDIRRNGRLFAERNQTGFGDLPILEVSLKTGVRVRDMDDQKRKQVMADREKYKRAVKGDIAYNMMRMWQGAVGVAPADGLVSPAYVVARPYPEAEPRFFSYLFRTDAYKHEVDGYSRGIVKDRNRLYWEDFKRMPSCVPERQEQKLIADYLDANAAQVNRFIRNRRRLIEVLNEQKQAIINRAATRGLDPTVPLRPSGIDWLGDVPAHWEVLSLKRVLLRLIDCEHKTAPATDSGDFFVVRTSAVRGGKLRWQGTYRTTAEAFRQWTQRGIPEPGDVIFTREAPAGEACVVPEGKHVCLGQRTVLMKPKPGTYDARFLVHMVYSGPPRYRIQLATQGSTVGHFNMDDIGWMRVLKPPLQEQIGIVESVGEETRGIDLAIEKAEGEIELIREYRVRLIADVVTGKLDVRHLAPTEPLTADDMADAELGDDDEISEADEPELAEETANE